MLKDKIKVDGHTGTWYVIERAEFEGKTLLLLESEQYGDDAAHIIVDEDCKLVAEDIWNGFSEYFDERLEI